MVDAHVAGRPLASASRWGVGPKFWASASGFVGLGTCMRRCGMLSARAGGARRAPGIPSRVRSRALWCVLEAARRQPHNGLRGGMRRDKGGKQRRLVCGGSTKQVRFAAGPAGRGRRP